MSRRAGGLAISPLGRLALAQTVSMAGDRLHHLALIALLTAWAATRGDAPDGLLFALGVVLFLPGLLLTPWLGPWLDRQAPAQVMASVDGVRALFVFLLPVVLARFPLTVGLAALFLFSSLNAFFLPVRGALPPRLVGRKSLARANALLVASAVIAAVAATALGGTLVDRLGWAAALRIDAVTYAASALLLWSLVRPTAPRATPPSARAGDLRRALAGLWSSARVRSAAATWCLLWALGGILQVAGVSRAVRQPGRVGELGVLAAVAAVGALAGAALARRRDVSLSRWTPAAGAVVLALAFCGLGLAQPGAVWVASLLALGAAAALLAAASETQLQRAVSPELRATAFGAREAGARIAFLLGAGTAWLLGETAGTPAALFSGSLLALSYGIVRSLPRGASRTASVRSAAAEPADSVA